MRSDGVVIVGGSAAGLSAADGLREGGYDGPITVLDQEVDPGYDRPMLSKGLLRVDSEAQPTPLRSAEQLAAKDITVLGYHRAVGLDIDRKFVVTDWGEALPWEHVVIASGVDAIRLRTTAGNDLPALRTREDLALARHLVASGQPVTCVGAGFIGLEVAAELRTRGLPVTLVNNREIPLELCLGRDVASWLLGLHRSNGVSFELGTTITRVDETDEGYLLYAADGRTFPASVVLSGLGSAPRTDWLLGSGVELDQGVLVDPAGRTNIAGVWAAGDVARTVDPVTGEAHRFEHWTHAIEQGRHVGLNITRSEPTAYEGVPYFWTEAYGHTIHVLGKHRPGDEVTLVQGDFASGAFVAVHGAGDELHAVTVCGMPAAMRTYKKLLRAGAPLGAALATTS